MGWDGMGWDVVYVYVQETSLIIIHNTYVSSKRSSVHVWGENTKCVHGIFYIDANDGRMTQKSTDSHNALSTSKRSSDGFEMVMNESIAKRRFFLFIMSIYKG